MAKIKYLPFPEFWETMLQTVYKDKTITGLSVVVNHGKGNAEICCRMCPYLSADSRICRLNGRIVEYPQKNIGGNCPLEPVEVE